MDQREQIAIYDYSGGIRTALPAAVVDIITVIIVFFNQSATRKKRELPIQVASGGGRHAAFSFALEEWPKRTASDPHATGELSIAGKRSFGGGTEHSKGGFE